VEAIIAGEYLLLEKRFGRAFLYMPAATFCWMPAARFLWLAALPANRCHRHEQTGKARRKGLSVTCRYLHLLA